MCDAATPACTAEQIDRFAGRFPEPARAAVVEALARRRDVVEQAGSNVDVTLALGAGSLEESLPMAARRLVGAGVSGCDGQINGYATLVQ